VVCPNRDGGRPIHGLSRREDGPWPVPPPSSRRMTQMREGPGLSSAESGIIPAVIETGTSLGPHQVLEPLRAGGMGEVYKARDTRLDRLVAIKVLPTHLSDDPEHRERFEREARTISGLNHPHICTLHDIGRQGDIAFLVEYLERETLGARLTKGALPIDQALALAIQIADALDRAPGRTSSRSARSSSRWSPAERRSRARASRA
jgi:serine/threonine protein kinase